MRMWVRVPRLDQSQGASEMRAGRAGLLSQAGMPDKSKGFPIVATDWWFRMITGVPKVIDLGATGRLDGKRTAIPLMGTGSAENLEHRQSVQVGASMIGTVRLARCFSPGRVSFNKFGNRKKDADMKSDQVYKALTCKATASKVMTFMALLLLAIAAPAQSTDANSGAESGASAPGTSKVRIVRLSQVRGIVQIDRHIGRGFENAIANLPVVEQSQIRTGVGVAEVEFEDNSSLRIAPNSLVEFPRLEREASGATASTVHLVKGTAYVSLVKQQDKKAPVNEFDVKFGARTLDLGPATHIRLDVADSQAKLAVFDGSVRTDGENGGVSVPKKKTAVFSIFDSTEPTVAKEIAPNEFDSWDEQETKYHANVASFSRFNSPYSYGLSDMSYYGAFTELPGCGMAWRPYFATAAWNPYGSGTWAYYGGAGYSWVSPYPWAWTPYHYGTWMSCGDAGWGWMPGGDWYGVNNVVATNVPMSGGGAVTGVHGPIRAPHVPSRPPMKNEPALVPVNSKPIPVSGINVATRSFVFQKDSAGLGVPRASLGRLNKFSNQAINHGFARTEIYATVPQSQSMRGTGRNIGTPSSGQILAGSIHRGSPPPPSYSSGSMGAWSRGGVNPGYRGASNSSSSVSSGSMGSSMGGGRSGGAPISAPVASAPVSIHK